MVSNNTDKKLEKHRKANKGIQITIAKNNIRKQGGGGANPRKGGGGPRVGKSTGGGSPPKPRKGGGGPGIGVIQDKKGVMSSYHL